MRVKLSALAIIAAICVIAAFAIESGPSNTVGFIAWDCPASQWMPFSFPFTYYNEGYTLTTDINDIMHGDFSVGDEIYDQNTLTSISFDGDEWSGAWNDIVPGHAYWAKIGNSEVTAITAGEVDLTEINLGTMEIGWNPVGLRDPGVVELENSDLIGSGFTGGENPPESDRIYDQNTLEYAWYNTATFSWVGLAEGLQPTHALWIWVHPNHSQFEWIYSPAGGTSALSQKSSPAREGSAITGR